MTEPENNKDFLKTLARGLSVIKSFDKEDSKMTLSEVARKNQMSRASARRFLLTLQSLGYISKESDQFSLAAKILELGHQYLSNLDFIEVILPLMREVSRELGKACSAAVLDGHEIVYIARIPSQQQILSVNLNVGSRLPAYCTSMGRVLLANLPDNELEQFLQNTTLKSFTSKTLTNSHKLRTAIRKANTDGYSFVDQELEESLRSLSIPVHNRNGNVVCAINVGMPVGQNEVKEIISAYLPVLKQAAQKAEVALAHHHVS